MRNAKEIQDILIKIEKENSSDKLSILKTIEIGELLGVVEDDEFNLFRCEQTFGSLLSQLFSVSPDYANLISKSINRCLNDWGISFVFKPMEIIAKSHPNELLELLDLVQSENDEKGIIIGVMLSWIILDNSDAKEFAIENIESKDPRKQRCCLVAMNYLIEKGHETDKSIFSDIIIHAADEILDENQDELLRSFVFIRKNLGVDTDDQLINILERKGLILIFNYLHLVQYYKGSSIVVLEKCLEILLRVDFNPYISAVCIGLIYEQNPSRAIEILENLDEKLMLRIIRNDEFIYIIRKKGTTELLKYIDKKIDGGDFEYIEEHILKDILQTDEEIIDWCERNFQDDTKRTGIINILRSILTDKINRQRLSDEILVRIVNLSWEIVQESGIDVGYAKHITYPDKRKEECVRLLFLLNRIAKPKSHIDISILEENLKKAPNLSKYFGYSWIIQNAGSNDPHYIVRLFSSSCESAKRHQQYWEGIFTTLDKNGITMDSEMLRNTDREMGALAEAEIISKLSISFSLDYHPDIPELLPKKPDAIIRYNGEEVIIEITSAKERIEVEEAHGPISVPGGKIKNCLLEKFRNQLFEGKRNPKRPVVIILYIESGLIDHYEIMNSIYGEYSMRLVIEKDAGTVIQEGGSRKENGFYETTGTEIINAVAVYHRNIDAKDPIVGKVYKCTIDPMNGISVEFLTEIRNTIFGNGYIDSPQSLMVIQNLDEKTARFLFSLGIEDVEELIGIEKNQVIVSKCGSEKAELISNEALRIVQAKITNSIQFLKGIEKSTLDLLYSKRIFLIRDFLEQRDNLPEIPKEQLKVLLDDAQYLQDITI